jgi:hypothetical protein
MKCTICGKIVTLDSLEASDVVEVDYVCKSCFDRTSESSNTENRDSLDPSIKSINRYPYVKISTAILLGQVYWVLFNRYDLGVVSDLMNVENDYVIINIVVGILSAKLCGRWSLLSGATSVPVYLICLMLHEIIAPAAEKSQAWEALLFIPMTLVLLFTSYIFYQIFQARAKAI